MPVDKETPSIPTGEEELEVFNNIKDENPDMSDEDALAQARSEIYDGTRKHYDKYYKKGDDEASKKPPKETEVMGSESTQLSNLGKLLKDNLDSSK